MIAIYDNIACDFFISKVNWAYRCPLINSSFAFTASPFTFMHNAGDVNC
jgi:hypothetical protein